MRWEETGPGEWSSRGSRIAGGFRIHRHSASRYELGRGHGVASHHVDTYGSLQQAKAGAEKYVRDRLSRLRRRRHARSNPDAAMWIALGVGVVGLGVGVYFLARGSPSNQLPSSSSSPAVTLFEQGKTYQFTAALPPGMPIDPVAITNALEAFGWTNVSISSITPGTYTATATCASCAPQMPPGTTATLA